MAVMGANASPKKPITCECITPWNLVPYLATLFPPFFLSCMEVSTYCAFQKTQIKETISKKECDNCNMPPTNLGQHLWSVASRVFVPPCFPSCN
jgi:hypothetical protein